MISAWRSGWCLAFGAALIGGTIGGAAAQTAPAGQFVAVVGEVRLVGRDGTAREAARGGEVREGDTIVTGSGALVQLRLADGGFLSIRADTETTLDRFAFTGKDDKDASLFISLLKGGFRSVTGLIGQLNRPGYKITTPSATIGIRGTDHEPFVVTPATAAALQLAAGTYDRVHSGQTFIQNRQGLTQFANPNQTLFVSDASAPPRLLPTPPPALYRVPTPVSGTPQQLQADPGAPDRRGAPAGAPGPADQKGLATTPGGLRELTPGAREALRATPPAGAQPGAGPALTTPSPSGIQQIQTTPPALQGPASASPIMTSPAQTPTIQPPPSAIQQAPVLQQQSPALQQSPIMKPMAPAGPVAPMQR